ncbi:MAG: hypothetical protein HGA39_09655 [Coriobacteriia bacterium]|nr:hypothetical protein [Coriobacteriia bacterium]
MSAIAQFHRVPTGKLHELVEAATPRKSGLFGKRKDNFWEYLNSNAKQVATLEWSGFFVADALIFLQENGIDLLDSGEYDAPVMRIVELREISAVALTPAHRVAYLDRLAGEPFSVAQLAEWHKEFTETDTPDAGEAMLNAIAALHSALSAVDGQTVVLVTIA